MNRIGVVRNRAKDVWHVQGFERLGFDPCPAIIHYRYNTDYPTRLEAVAQASALRKIKPHIQADWYRI